MTPQEENAERNEQQGEAQHSEYRVPGKDDERTMHHLSGMYQHWFLDYASYVILERAVPHINDGLKPVQRRILHSMKRLDDGRYNKVANIVGHTMQFHPHGDASIGDALVQLGQKDLLIDCQGNWGNILTGDGAAAPRYIEARLSKFALETVFNPKTTVWQLSYDGRNREPVTLPIKFPLLLAQGVEGIAVGLSSKILPHNFNELLDASVAYLRGEEFALYPDFQTGGYIDVSKYNDGERGGSVKIRAKIGKIDSKTLVISEIPYGRTTSSVIDSILKANDKGKIKIKKVDDNTAKHVEILVHLAPGVSSDKTIDALYAFTDCEVSVSPNCCVIQDDKPRFLTVSDVLRHSADNTLALLRQELEIEKGELSEALFFASLEKIFIEERIYKDKEFEEAGNMDEAVRHIDLRLEPGHPRPLLKNRKEVRHPLANRNVPTRRRPVRSRIKTIIPAKSSARIVGQQLELLERRDAAELRHGIDIQFPYLRIVHARRIIFGSCPARLIAARSAPRRMIPVHRLRQIRRLHSRERRFESELPENLHPRRKDIQIPLRILRRQIRLQLLRHNILEQRRTMKTPVRIGIIPVHVPLPHARLDLRCGKMGRPQLRRQFRQSPILLQIRCRTFQCDLSHSLLSCLSL